MHTYYFQGKLTLAEVKSIISEAKYNVADYRYQPMVSNGFRVTGNIAMALSRLENAAKILKITVEISSPNGETLSINGRTSVMLDISGYQIDITMDAFTVNALTDGGYNLYGFKAIQSANKNGRPLIWFQSQQFGLITSVSWEEKYEAFTSNQQIIPGGQIKAVNSYGIGFGGVLTVDNPSGTGTVTTTGIPTAIEVVNKTTTQLTCGISQVKDGQPNPMCAFPLYGQNLDVVAPIEKVLLLFSTLPLDTGTVVIQSFGPGLLIDLTSSNQRQVKYNINTGWSPTTESWTKPVPVTSDLVQLLIDVTPQMIRSSLEATLGQEIEAIV